MRRLVRIVKLHFQNARPIMTHDYSYNKNYPMPLTVITVTVTDSLKIPIVAKEVKEQF